MIVGGEFQFLNILEYIFFIMVDDMFKGVLFCDYGMVESFVMIDEDNFCVVFGFGFRINLLIGGVGGALLVFDFGFLVVSVVIDDCWMFSFYMVVLR